MIIECKECRSDIYVNILNWKPNIPIYILCESCLNKEKMNNVTRKHKY